MSDKTTAIALTISAIEAHELKVNFAIDLSDYSWTTISLSAGAPALAPRPEYAS
jgi:hypothetical protein